MNNTVNAAQRNPLRAFIPGLLIALLMMLPVLFGCMEMEESPTVVAPSAPPSETGDEPELEPEPSQPPRMEMRTGWPPPTGSYADVIEGVLDSVVNIFTTKQIKDVPGMDQFGQEPLFRWFFGPDAPAIPREQHSLGSGVVLSPDGYILTNSHVVEGMDEVNVFLHNKKQFDAKIVGTDPQTDVALLKIEAEGLKVIPFGDSDGVRIGDVVLAIGSPFGLDHTVTMGIISAKGRSGLRVLQDKDFYGDFLQTDAAINPGNSGGALIDHRGRLVGINTAIYSRTGGYQGVGFAIPINMAQKVSEALRTGGKVVRGWLGVMIQNINQDMARAMKLESMEGALVSDVIEGGPAQEAGVLRGDVIVGFQDMNIADVDQLRNTVSLTAPGTKTKVTLLRNGKEKTLTVVVGELEKGMKKAGIGIAPKREDDTLLGVRVMNLTDEAAARYGVAPSIRGVLVVGVEPGGKAEDAGIQEADVIVEVNREPVETVSDFRALVEKGEDEVLLLLVNRGGSTLFVAIR